MASRSTRRLKRILGQMGRTPLTRLSQLKGTSALAWAGFIFFGIAITWMTSFSVSHFPESTPAGTVLRRDIRADKKISIVNEEETKKDKEAASESVLPVFDYDERVPEEASKNTKEILSRPIVLDAETLVAYKNKGIVLRRLSPPKETSQEEKEIILRDLQHVLTVAKAKQIVPPVQQKWVQPNTLFSLQETEARKEAAIRSVKEKTITYQPGDYILRKGTKLEDEHVVLLERLRKARGFENRLIRFAGTFLFVALALSATFYFSEKFLKRFLLLRKDYLLMGLVILTMLTILRASILFAGVLHEAFFYDIPLSALYYAIPIAGGVMLVRMVLPAEVTLILGIILSLLSGLTIGSDINYTTFALISCIAAGSAIQKADRRSAIIKAGFWTGIVNAVAVLGIQFIHLATTEASFHWENMAFHLGFAFLGGILASIFVFLAAPMMEYLLDYTTDIKLLELANLNHPLLKELIVRAPGTYHHSHIVGVLAEAAAEAINANPLLARVSAYYHDIGKMKKPSYFVENSGEAHRIYDRLSPHMSALIILSHIKEGMALAKAHKLPQKIIDMIPQHHGTKRIGTFYERALEQTDAFMQQIDEKDFRYPGPKPQSQEAGILMLADGAEAAVRSLKEKSPTRIKQRVEQMIDASFAEAQLDECDLTLKDLHEIAKVFTRILTALYHQRMEYAQDTSDQSSSSPKTTSEEAKAGSKENVHRLKFPQGS